MILYLYVALGSIRFTHRSITDKRIDDTIGNKNFRDEFRVRLVAAGQQLDESIDYAKRMGNDTRKFETAKTQVSSVLEALD